MTTWSPDTWQQQPCKQQPTYTDTTQLNKVVERLSQLPPLVTVLEIEALKQQLAEAGRGERFILQGGDCAENIDICHAEGISAKLKILLQMSVILLHGMRKPVTRIGRIAGQYAKPRSSDTETRDGITLPAYRGDLINRHEFTETARNPNPKLMLQGYHNACTTLNYIRALVDGGFADLNHPEYWTIDFETDAPLAKRYHELVNSIKDPERFLADLNIHDTTSSINFYTAHEALLLYYEQALTRQENGKWYNLSTHYPWIGLRTAGLGEGHLEYMRGIANPVSVKIGPSISAEHLTELVETLNPENEAGRLTLTHRLGAENITEHLPTLIETVRKTGIHVVWVCDPMHGNTKTTNDGIKTRYFADIMQELQQAFAIHQQCGSHLGGVHFELTGENVTECVGGSTGLSESQLHHAYESLVDPRLNYNQALEIAMMLAYSRA